MSMTYYAVTNDPNDLAHFGIPGMKWGVRHDRPRHSGSRSRRRSAAYNRASSKLGKLMKSGIRKAQASWRTYNSPAAKEARFMNRSLEKARKGNLKYGKLTDAQVQRITERLALERNARQLGTSEATFMGRLKKSIGEGVIQGVGQGVGRIVSEKVSRGSTLKTDRLRAEQQAEFDKAKERRQIKNEIRKENEKATNTAKNARKQAKRDAEAEYIKTRIEEGDSVGFMNRVANRLPGATRRRINYLHDTKERNELAKKISERDANIDKMYYEAGARARAIKDANTSMIVYDPKTGTTSTMSKYQIELENERARRRANARGRGRGRI